MKKTKYLKITMLFLLVLCIFTLFLVMLRNVNFYKKEQELVQNIEGKLESKTEELEVNKEEIIFADGEIGIILIPSLDVKAPIYEGTSSDILKYSVGHFIETSLWDGNVVLASHNRGSYAHYFSKIGNLKNGEEIIYKTRMGERRYKVTESKVIEETNVEVLQNTKENSITLITCITGQRNKRRCVIAKQYI